MIFQNYLFSIFLYKPLLCSYPSKLNFQNKSRILLTLKLEYSNIMTIKFINCFEKMSSLRSSAQRVTLDEK
jgi:hypothetical protein